ncbi:methyl-accepting chemotaxis protein [Vibrio tapetis]|uniref:Methyl-accepting chemotaxis protein n=1 Tax=Vibrio tapetis subsp. tapetis TaxID=1671868 RepID=A0A2N8ZM85_9VIBR
MQFGNLSLKAKISLGTGVPLILLILLSFITLQSSNRQDASSKMVDHTHKVIEQAMRIEGAAVDMETGMRGFLLSGKDEFLSPYNSGKQRFRELVSSLKQTVDDNPAQVERLSKIQSNIDEWIANVTAPAIELRREVGRGQTMDNIATLVGEARGKVYFDRFRGQIAEFIEIESSLMETRQASASGATASARYTIVGGTLLAIILGFSLAWAVLKSISQPVEAVARGLTALANGDLTTQISIDSRDELGQMAKNYNQAVSRTQQAMKHVYETTIDVSNRSENIVQANEKMAQDLTQQANQVAHISNSIDEIALSIQEVAQQSANATSSAQDAGVKASSGGNIVRNTIKGMNAISEAVSASSTSVSELGRRGTQIGDIINVINDIAEQTNLLALNAAIEAARAGEAGRGFAVVADEVRTLADRTTTATQEIAKSIEAIQSETQMAVERMESGTEHVNEGMTLVTQAGKSLDDIVAGTDVVSGMIDSIAAASEEQSQASAEVSKNVISVSEVSKNANSQASQTASSARELAQHAEQLKGLVSQFTL